jgi:FKBP-type peptidyl-prolyl cis-trans isomerase
MRLSTIALISTVFMFGCETKPTAPTAKDTKAVKTAAKTTKATNASKASKAAKTAAKPAATTTAVKKAPPTAKDISKLIAQAKAKSQAKGTAPMTPKGLPAPADVAAAPADAVKTASGLSSKVLKAGTGKAKPSATDTVKVHYTGWMTNGKMFDSSVTRGTPASFPLNRVIKGWTEGVALMVVGEKRRFWIPAALAYGDKPSRPGGPSGTLVFDVELLEIEKAPSGEENVARFEAFMVAFKAASKATCQCKDMPCIQKAMMALRAVKPPTTAPTPEQIKRMDPHRKAMRECAEKAMKGMGRPVPTPAPGSATKIVPKPATKPATK